MPSIDLPPSGPQGAPRPVRHRDRRARLLRLAVAGLAFVTLTKGTQDATANGDTRSLSIFHTHTRETLTVTYRRDGRYDDQALSQLNWLLRDWRNDDPIKMDPRLFDILWELHREVGSREAVHIISAYRSPETNGMLRRRSNGVSEHSQHMLGKAMDIRLPDVDTARLRASAMRLQYGGVGYYNSSAFVHIDTGSVRAWPRMSQDQLVRLFPDGKTLHLPANGKPLPGYDVAKAEITSRNAALATQAAAGGGSVGSLLAGLFGRSKPAPSAPPASAPVVVASAAVEAEPVETAAIAPPLPPRRPALQAIVVASADPEMIPTLPPARSQPAPDQVAAPAAVAPATEWTEPKVAARALFDSRTATLNVTFSALSPSDLTISRFTGPAVKPLPLLRQASL